MAQPRFLSTCATRPTTHNEDQDHSPTEPRDIRQSADPCPATTRWNSRRPKTNRTSDAQRRSCRLHPPSLSGHDDLQTQAPIAPNLLARRFAPDDVAAIDRVYASDITYIDTMEGWLYLAVILDHSLRRISRQRWRNTGRIATFPTTKNYSEPLVSGSHRLSQSQRGKRCASALRLKMAPSSSSRPRIDRFEHRIRPRDAHASLVADLLSCFPMEAMARERLLNDSSKELPSHHPFKREIPSC